ncbi:MAG: transposase [Cytophagales bacterium]|nr:transposase [Cytophagales bacterium]
MEPKKRSRFSIEEKVNILKQHLLEKKALSDLCDENNIHPTMFYRWQKELFSNAAFALNNSNAKEIVRWKKKTLELEEKLTRKNEVLSELMEEHIALKKSLGES